MQQCALMKIRSVRQGPQVGADYGWQFLESQPSEPASSQHDSGRMIPKRFEASRFRLKLCSEPLYGSHLRWGPFSIKGRKVTSWSWPRSSGFLEGPEKEPRKSGL